MIARFLDVLEDTVKNPTWRPAELQAIDAPPALDYRTPDYTANAAKYMDLYGAKRRAEAKYAEALERAEQARRNVAVVLEKTSPATLAALARSAGRLSPSCACAPLCAGVPFTGSSVMASPSR